MFERLRDFNVETFRLVFFKTSKPKQTLAADSPTESLITPRTMKSTLDHSERLRAKKNERFEKVFRLPCRKIPVGDQFKSLFQNCGA